MNPMVLFAGVALALCFGVAAVWWWTLRRSCDAAMQPAEGDPVGSNVAVYREQLADLEREREQIGRAHV